jgi:propionyl-CoA synthetase
MEHINTVILQLYFQPKVIVSANCGVEPNKSVPYKPMLDGALNLCAFKPSKCIIYNRPGVCV